MSENKPVDAGASEKVSGYMTWEQIEAALMSRLASVEGEIRHYPTPIPACDAQFNYLLEQRSQFQRALAKARVALNTSASKLHKQPMLDEFDGSCLYMHIP